VAAERVGTPVHHSQAWTVEVGAEPAFGDRQPDAHRHTLAKRPGSRLDAGGEMVFGMAWTGAVELAERLYVIEGHGGPAQKLIVGTHRLRPSEVQQGVKQHGGVAGGEDEAVTVGPDRVGWVEIQPLLPKAVDDGGHAHRRAGMAGLRFLDRV